MNGPHVSKLDGSVFNDFFNKYDLGTRISKTPNGEVFNCIRISDEKEFAVKVV